MPPILVLEEGHASRFLTTALSPIGLPRSRGRWGGGAGDSGGECPALWPVVYSPGNPFKLFLLTDECLCSGTQEWPQG